MQSGPINEVLCLHELLDRIGRHFACSSKKRLIRWIKQLNLGFKPHFKVKITLNMKKLHQPCLFLVQLTCLACVY